ncbi:hypothetical protein OYE22_11290 [Streptomyces sp. 71268]|uniref:hypothetical protein n=1 Tax=Streptomyces sp. 71268 TaxID=3002640 RepID=UPI0023F7B5F1|nr:hypothetical protein [Streptomyces sp. 71268]WEV25720.1 hypothetical protein OYE22_11290 [Streptomyces sp. 71268]
MSMRKAARVSMVGLAALALTLPATAAVADTAPTELEIVRGLASKGDYAYLSEEEWEILKGAGVFETHGDYVHISGSAPRAVSAHGWWKRKSGPAKYAKVTIELQAHAGAKWKTIDTGTKKKAKSGGGSANRAHARKNCKNATTVVKFRSRVDVDIIGYSDPPTKLVTPTRKIKCKV